MKQLELWFLNNNIITNVNKTKAMLFHLKNNNVIHAPHILYKNEKISYIPQLNFGDQYFLFPYMEYPNKSVVRKS
jgi:hypothetical protein